MLVIRRRAGESILIGEGIEIEIIELTQTRVKLGITAPEQVQILRKEVQLTREQNQAASHEVSRQQLGPLLAFMRRK